MKIKLIAFTPEVIAYRVVYSTFRLSKVVFYNPIFFTCTGGINIIRHVHIVDYDKVKVLHLRRWK